MEYVACNLCNSKNHRQIYSIPDSKYFRDETFSVVECCNCGLGFTNPRPTRDEIGRYYPSTFYEYFDNEREFHDRRYLREAQMIERFAPRRREKRLLLDVGCANGDFPRVMRRRGWDVEGVEISEASKSINDFIVYKEEFDTIPIQEARYDAVTAWAVIEHVHDPKAYFEKARAVLKPGGVFVFLVTDFGSISSRYLFGEDVPRHLYFFTKPTVTKYLEQCGLKLSHVDYSNKIYGMRPSNWLHYYIRFRMRGRVMKWQDLPLSRPAFFAKHGLSRGLLANIRYCMYNPLIVPERVLLPLLERYQMLTGTYGIATYVAVKPRG